MTRIPPVPEKTKGGQHHLTSGTSAQAPRAGPSSVSLPFQPKTFEMEEKPPNAVREPGLSVHCFLEINIQVYLNLKPQGSLSQPVARETRSEREKLMPSCTHLAPPATPSPLPASPAASEAALKHSWFSDSPTTCGDLAYKNLFLQKYRPWEEGQMPTPHTWKCIVALFAPGK